MVFCVCEGGAVLCVGEKGRGARRLSGDATFVWWRDLVGERDHHRVCAAVWAAGGSALGILRAGSDQVGACVGGRRRTWPWARTQFCGKWGVRVVWRLTYAICV